MGIDLPLHAVHTQSLKSRPLVDPKKIVFSVNLSVQVCICIPACMWNAASIRTCQNRQVCTSNHTIFYILHHFLVDMQKPF